METALFLLVFCLFLACTVLYLRHAFSATVGWGLAGVLVPPSAILFYGLSWPKLRPLALVHLTSVVALLFVSVLWVRSHPYSFDDTRLSGMRDWLAPAYSRYPMSIEPVRFATEQQLLPYLKSSPYTTGFYNDEPLTFVRATFVNGVLRFKSDENLFSSTEVSIPLHHVQLSEGENLLEYTPESSDIPTVYVTYYRDGAKTPEVDVYDHQYWLELLLSKKNDTLYAGYIKLRLPDGKQSFLAGEFRAFTRDLRYDGDVVDRFFDSNATIEYVAEQYLLNKLGNKLDRVTGFDDTFFQTALENPTARTEASLKLFDGSQHRIKLGLIKGSEGWAVESGPIAELISALQAMQKQPSSSIRRQPLQDSVGLVDPDAMEKLVGKNVLILTRDGKQREGVISDVDRYNITLASPVEGGTIGMLVKRREITEVKLRH